MADINPDYLAGLAQLETAGGTKTAAPNNLYNIKDFSGGGVKAYDKAEGSNDAYKSYASPADSTADIVNLLQRKYPAAVTAQTPQAFAQALHDGGYATDPNYVSKLTNTIIGGHFNPNDNPSVTTAAATSTALPAVGFGTTLSGAGAWTQRGNENTPGNSAKRSLNTDSDGNPVSLNGLENAGVLAASLAQGPAGAVAARHDPDAASALAQSTIPGGDGSPLADAPQAQPGFTTEVATNDAEAATEAKRQAVTVAQGLGARAMTNGAIGAVVKMIARPQFGDPIPNFGPSDEDVAGKSADQVAELNEATNPLHLNWIKFNQNENAQNAQTIAAHSGVSGLALDLISGAGDPAMYIAPFAAAKLLKITAGIGSAAYAEAGQSVKAGLTAFGENAVANVAMTDAEAKAVNEKRSNGDYFSAAAMALLPGVMHGISGWSGGERAHAADDINKTPDAVISQQKSLAQRATALLPENPTSDQISAKMDELETSDITGTIQGNVTKLGQDRQLMPHPDDVKEQLAREAEIAEANKPAPAEGAAPEPEPAPEPKVEGMPDPLSEEEKAEGDAPITGDLPDPNSLKLNDGTPDAIQPATHAASSVTHFSDTQGTDAARDWQARNNPNWVDNIKGTAEGMTMAEADKLSPGVHVQPDLASIPAAAPALRAIEQIRKLFGSSDTKFIVGALDPNNEAIVGSAKRAYAAAGKMDQYTPPTGTVTSVGNTHFIGILPNSSPTAMLKTAMHEVGHAIWHENIGKVGPELRARLQGEVNSFVQNVREGKASARFQRYSEGSSQVIDENNKLHGKIAPIAYNLSADEYSAEAFVRYVQKNAREGNGLELTPGVVGLLKAAWEKVKAIWDKAQSNGWLAKDEAFPEFFDKVRSGELDKPEGSVDAPAQYLDAGLTVPNSLEQGSPPKLGALPNADDTAQRHGLDILPEGTPGMAGEKRMITSLYQKADQWSAANPKDTAWDKRAGALTDNSVFNVASTGLIMLKSKNPVVRMVAAELLEDAGGVVGHRNSTAAISKYMHERLFMGNAINEIQNAFDSWKKQNGGSLWDDLMHGQKYDEFNKKVAVEIESRRQAGGGKKITSEPEVSAAADAMENGYERMRKAQVDNETLGWAGLPANSVGYMPHKMNSGKVRNLSTNESGVLLQAMVDQFAGIHGWDPTFSANLAAKYIDRIKQKALGGYDAPIGLHQTGAADVVEDAMTAMGLSRAEIAANMKRYYNAGPGHTKARIDMDLLATHTASDGTSIRLLDLFDTNQLHLMRNQAMRVSGDVALARHGVYGKPGLALLRRAMGYGADGERATPKEIEQFDQVSSEFLGEPFGSVDGKWMERARILNSASRLGGIVFNQFSEFINGIAHVGVGKTLAAVGSIGRLRGEIIALSKGETVNNPLLTSLEHMGGAEFGTDAYKMSFPYDSPDNANPTYGRDTITAADRILRGSVHLQSKISFWRAIHESQNRGMAEQIVQKAAQFIKSGKDDAALNDMGINDDIRSRLGADIDKIATFDSTGRLTSFDLMKATDVDAANQFTQAVWRGTKQIIQGHFIGEQGKWVHSGFLKMLTQFRGFGITSIEKQWARQKNNQGTAKALGIMIGGMSVAVPVYMARVYVDSIGRSDQQDYLAKNLTPYMLTRATMNYISISGLAGDFLDAATAVAPDSATEAIGAKPVGTRSGGSSEKPFVGNIIAPAAGYANDIWSTLQNLDKPGKAAKLLPFSRVPFLIPAVNALGNP